MQRQITGFSNPTVKYLRSLRDKKHRKRAGQFLVEGLRLLEDARSMGRVPQMLVMAENRAPHELLAQLEDAVAAAGGDVITTTPDILTRWFELTYLRPTTAGRTLDISATGEAGLDFDNIKAATGATTLTNITVPNVTTLTGHTAQTGDAFARLGAPIGASMSADIATLPTAQEIVDAVWDELLAGHAVAGSTGEALNDAGAAGTPPTVEEISTAMLSVLTSVGVSAAAGTTRSVRRGDSWEIQWTDLGDISDWAEIWFTAKKNLGDADADAYIMVKKTVGLSLWDGESATAGNATLTIDDAVAGDITVAVVPAQTEDAEFGTYHYDVQVKRTGGEVETPASAIGKFVITKDVTNAVA
jgi:hypothetical protein